MCTHFDYVNVWEVKHKEDRDPTRTKLSSSQGKGQCHNMWNKTKNPMADNLEIGLQCKRKLMSYGTMFVACSFGRAA